MLKYRSADILEDPQPSHRRRNVCLVLALLLMAPFIYEGAMMIAARWRGLYGQVAVVDTPFIDAASHNASWAGHHIGRMIDSAPWEPGQAMLACLAIAAVSGLLLRSRR